MADSSKKVVTTIGTKVSFAFETTAGTKPTTGYTVIPGVSSIPSTDVAKDKIDITDLSNLVNKTYTNGLKDYGDLEFEANLSESLYDLYFNETTGIMTKYAAAVESGLRMWICIDPSGLSKSLYIPVEPQEFGIPEGGVAEAMKPKLRFTPVGDSEWGADPTYAA